MKLGFGRADLSPALDFAAMAKPAVARSAAGGNKYSREEKFDITDRVKGLWRPDAGGRRRQVAPIYATAMAGESPRGPFVLLALDLCILSFREVDEIRELLRSRFGYRIERILLLPSHVHITVRFDRAKYRAALAAAVRAAREDLGPVEMAAAHLNLDAKKFFINRRVHVPGLGTRTVMFNDGCRVLKDRLDATPQMEAWIRRLGGLPREFTPPGGRYLTGHTLDPRLQALFFRRPGGKKLSGAMIRVSNHPVIVSEKRVKGDISADFPGYLRAAVEKALGGIALFGQGTSGDIRPLNPEYSHAFAKKFGLRLAAAVVPAERTARWAKLESGDFLTSPLVLPLRVTGLSAGAAREALARIERRYDRARRPRDRRRLHNQFWHYYRRPHIENFLRPAWKRQGRISTAVSALRLNGEVIVAAPGELFVKTGRAIARGAADRPPMILAIVNEYISYLPPREEFERGGYEPSVCVAKPGAAEKISAACRSLIKRVLR